MVFNDNVRATPELTAPSGHAAHEHASFGRRAAGFAIDYVFEAALAAAMCCVLLATLIPHVYTRDALKAVLAVTFLGPGALSFGYRWAGNAFGGTIGKRVVGIRVVRAGTDADAGAIRGLFRTLMAVVSGIPFGFGYVSAAWDNSGRAWHDKASGTAVVDAVRAGALDDRGRVNRPTPVLIATLVALGGLVGIAGVGFVSAQSAVHWFKVEGASMEPAYSNGQTLTIVKHDTVKRGDVIVFRFPLDPSRDFFKRVIGMPGDTVEVKSEKVLINGEQLMENYILATPNYSYGPKKVPPGMYFVLGDNRRNSYDSHAWGNSCPAQQQCDFVPKGNIIGQVLR
jgi:signal peptidase I